MKNLFFLLCFIALKGNAQIRGGIRADYSSQYHVGTGIECGYLIKDMVYVGADVNIFLFNRKVNRSQPIFTEAVAALKLNKIQPFIRAGMATTGAESIRSHEGFQSFTFGGGIGYIVSDFVKLVISVRTHKIKEGSVGENSVLKPGTHINGIISFTFGLFN